MKLQKVGYENIVLWKLEVWSHWSVIEPKMEQTHCFVSAYFLLKGSQENSIQLQPGIWKMSSPFWSFSISWCHPTSHQRHKYCKEENNNQLYQAPIQRNAELQSPQDQHCYATCKQKAKLPKPQHEAALACSLLASCSHPALPKRSTMIP